MNVLDSKLNILVCPTNGQGIMGGGVAKQFKATFPGLKTAYSRAIRRGEQLPGRLFFWQALDGTIICCLPVKQRWDEPSNLGDALAGLKTLSEIQRKYGISVSIPPVGCGFGGLNWKHDIFPFVQAHFIPSLTELCWEE